MRNKGNEKKGLKKWISVLITLSLLLGGVVLYECVVGDVVTVQEESTPLCEGYPTRSAEFYINTSGNLLADGFFWMCKYAGSGTVVSPKIVFSKPESVKRVLCAVPDVSTLIDPTMDVEWGTVTYALGKFRVIGQIVEKKVQGTTNNAVVVQLSYDCVEEMKSAQVKVGQIVKTSGFYHVGDGGAATYLITAGGKTADGYLIINLQNGLQAELQIQNGTIVAEQFGALGDGEHDDTVPLQKIIDMGYNLELTRGKVYKLISNGLYISNPITINGNDATILVDDSYAPQNGDFNYYCIRYQYGKRQTYFGINNLNIHINFSDGRISGREFVGVSPLYIDTVNLNGLNVITNDSNNCVICVWLDRGCSSFVLKNSCLENHTTGATGGALWLTSKDDEIFGTFNAIEEGLIQDTMLYGTSGDEVLAIWGTNDLNITFENCTIEGNIGAPGCHTRPIVVMGESSTGGRFDVDFDDCTIKARRQDGLTDTFYDSLLGIGTKYATSYMDVNFNNCVIDSDVQGAMIFPNGYDSDKSHLSEFDNSNSSVHVNFTDCDIDTTHPITGSSMTYYDTAVLYPSPAWNCAFENCDIVCETSFAYLYMPWSKEYFVPQISLDSCKVGINNAKDFICKGDMAAMIELELLDTTIRAEGVEEILTEQTNVRSIISTQKNAVNQVVVRNSSLNNSVIIQ